MVKPKIKNNIARLHALIKQLSTIGPFARGSVVRIGPRKVPIFSLNKDKKTHLVYLGESRIAQATHYSQNYQQLLDLSEQITLIVMELLRAGVPDREIWPPPLDPARKKRL